MNFVRFSRLLFFIFLTILCLAGCNYHGRIRRGIYKEKDFPNQIEARVLVISDKYLSETFSFKDGNLSPVNEFRFSLLDGGAVAAADALGTLFTRVDAGPEKLSSAYDFVAEVEYTLESDNQNYTDYLKNSTHFLWLERQFVPGFLTKVTLTLRNPHTKLPILQFSASRRSDLSYNSVAVGLHWFNELTFSLLFPVIAPAYIESAGISARRSLEKDLTDCLREIMKKVEDNRIVLEPGYPHQSLPRRDGNYKEMLEKVVYLETFDGHGTGFFISKDGWLLTNAHVVENQRDVRYYLYQDLPFEPFRSDTPLRYARVIKVNKTRDLALLKAEGEFPFFELDANRAHYKTGETVLVLGNPRHSLWTVTEGIISGLSSLNGSDQIQVDAAINPGNSGGPLVAKSSGKAIGVNTLMTRPELGSGLNFSLSAFEVLRTLTISQNIEEGKLLPVPENTPLQD